MSRFNDHSVSRRRALQAAGGAAAVVSLAACGGNSGKTQPAAASSGLAGRTGRRVTFVTHDNNSFFVPVIIGFHTFGNLRGWKMNFVGQDPQTPQQTLSLMEDAVSQKPDGLGLTRIDDHSFDQTIESALSKGIKVVLYNVASDGYQKLGIGFVGQDFIPAGQVNGTQACKYAEQVTGRRDGEIVLAEVALGNSALTQRVEGAQRGIEAYNKQHGTRYTTSLLVTSTDQPQAISAIDNKWTANGDKIVCWCQADDSSYSVSSWASSRGLHGKFANGGFDLIPQVLSGIKAGTQQWAIGQNPYAQGWVTSAFLDMEMEAGYPAYTYDTGAELVTSANVRAVAAREAKFAHL